MDPLRIFLLDQGFPVEYELDEFNTPHTGTTLRHPQNWLYRLRCKIPPRHLATSPLGNIFWRHSRFSPKQPEPQTHGDFNVSLLKQQTQHLLHYGEHISLARPTTRATFSTPWCKKKKRSQFTNLRISKQNQQLATIRKTLCLSHTSHKELKLFFFSASV